MYKQQPIVVLDYRIIDDSFIISTSAGIEHIKKNKIESALQEFLPAESDKVAVRNKSVPQSLATLGDNEEWKGVKSVSFDLINKLKSDEWKKHVEQAEAVNSAINTLVNVMKTEIEIAKIISK